ncbi:uncharacterized protein LOC125647097 [Ostrea edulis]|uniref:uncharacterized protein LOC125647097 n=1 Tax=Ostrea edulis TaxID=37623 RepID=UPI0024AF709A|nr:uncharacterized protein LOC125647097 [Ostrea edulis]
MFSSTQEERNASFPSQCMTMAKVPGCSTPYRAGLIDAWEELGVQEVRFTIIVNSTWTQEIVFNGLDSNKTSWYSGNRVESSSWTDVTDTQTYLYFSVNGYSSTSVNRLWAITYSHGGCEGDLGWFMASYNPFAGCSYDRTLDLSPYPVLLVCPKSTKCKMHSETVKADAFAVAIKADKLK